MKKKNLKLSIVIVSLLMALAVVLTACGNNSGSGNTGNNSENIEIVTGETGANSEGDDASLGNDASANDGSNDQGEISSSPSAEPEVKTYVLADLEDLENTENFAKNTIEHIFNGTINSRGKATGYHYDMVTDSEGYIVDGTRSEEDKNGLYTGNVEVNGVKKSHYSTFFPDDWTPQQVVDAINIAMEDALDIDRHEGDLYIGYYEDIEIDMYFNNNGKITTAYPVYETDRH